MVRIKKSWLRKYLWSMWRSVSLSWFQHCSYKSNSNLSREVMLEDKLSSTSLDSDLFNDLVFRVQTLFKLKQVFSYDIWTLGAKQAYCLQWVFSIGLLDCWTVGHLIKLHESDCVKKLDSWTLPKLLEIQITDLQWILTIGTDTKIPKRDLDSTSIANNVRKSNWTESQLVIVMYFMCSMYYSIRIKFHEKFPC